MSKPGRTEITALVLTAVWALLAVSPAAAMQMSARALAAECASLHIAVDAVTEEPAQQAALLISFEQSAPLCPSTEITLPGSGADSAALEADSVTSHSYHAVPPSETADRKLVPQSLEPHRAAAIERLLTNRTLQ